MNSDDWISVKDHLPEKSGYYWIKGISGSIDAKEFVEKSFFVIRSNGFCYWNTCFDWKRATHWKPMEFTKDGAIVDINPSK